VAANLPSLTGRALDAVRVNAAADGVEFADVTAAGWALLDDANATAQLVTLGAAPSASPTFTGTPTAPTQTAGNNSTLLATTAYTRTAIPDVLNATGSAPVLRLPRVGEFSNGHGALWQFGPAEMCRALLMLGLVITQ